MPALYRRSFSGISEIFDLYDLLLLWSRFDLLEEILTLEMPYFKYILLYETYEGEYKDPFEKIEAGKYGDIRLNRYTFPFGSFFLIELQPKKSFRDIGVYVVTHKPWHVIEEPPYFPICVGDSYRNDVWLCEREGNNISYLNDKINECTALYWIWKNSDKEIVGISHYRRYFYRNEIECYENILDAATIEALLKDYDLILPKSEKFIVPSVYPQLAVPLTEDVLNTGYQVIRNALEKHQPTYVRFFDTVLHGHTIYLCNMLVTRKEIFDRYCEWLFSFLIEAAEEIDTSKYEGQNKRIMGFLAERMLTVWLMGQKLRIKELPYMIV